MTQSPLQPTLGELVATMTHQMTTLVKDEIALFKAQLAEKGQRFGIGIGLFVGAAVLGFFAFAVLITTGILALALVLQPWAAALIMFGVLIVLAAVLALIGKKQFEAASEVKPAVTENLKHDLDIVKEGLHP